MPQMPLGSGCQALDDAGMCGRYLITSSLEAIRRVFEVLQRPNLKARYNVAPTQQVPVVRLATSGRELVQLRWGLIPSWAKDLSIGAKMINARAETVAEKPAFRSAFKRRRCLVVADGFYEWQRGADGEKQPYVIGLDQEGPMAIAGLWEVWKDPAGERLESCTIITTAANKRLEAIHHRMPVILGRADFETWLTGGDDDPNTLRALLRPYPEDRIKADPVSRHVNSVRNDDPRCLEPIAVQQQLSLS